MRALNICYSSKNWQKSVSLKRKECIVFLITYLFTFLYPIVFITQFLNDPNNTNMETYLDTYFREIWYGVLLMTIALFISSTLLIRQVDPEMFVQLGQDTRMVRNTVMIFCFGFFLRLLMSCLCSVESIRDHAVRIALHEHAYFVLS